MSHFLKVSYERKIDRRHRQGIIKNNRHIYHHISNSYDIQKQGGKESYAAEAGDQIARERKERRAATLAVEKNLAGKRSRKIKRKQSETHAKH